MADKLRAVIAGCGGIAGCWLKECVKFDDLAIVGLMDIAEDSAVKRRDEFELGDAVVGTDLDAMLGQTKPDMVFDCTIPEAHVDVVLTAIKHGCHVLGEKPLADSMENARKMVDAAKQAGVTYAVIQNRRYLEPIIRLRKLLDSGVIGKVTTVDCDFYIGAHFGGFRDEMDHVLLLDMAIHTFDAARMISGADPLSVYCKEWNPPGSWYKHGASAVAIFDMSNEIVYTYRGSWCSEGANTTWESSWRIVGQKGSITWDGAEDFKVQVTEKAEGLIYKSRDIETESLGEMELTGHGAIIREFMDCVKSGDTPQTTASDNIKSLAMVFGAIESAEAGNKVEIKA